MLINVKLCDEHLQICMFLVQVEGREGAQGKRRQGGVNGAVV